MAVLTRPLATVILVLAAVMPAHAFGWGLFRSPTRTSSSSYYSSSYYCAVPVVAARPAYRYYYSSATPVYATPPVVYGPAVAVTPSIQPNPVYAPRTPVPVYAQPTPAPPSQGKEPPTTAGKPSGPRVTEETQEPPTAPAKPTKPNKSGGPKVSESHSFYNPYTGTTTTSTQSGNDSRNGLVQVGFWNTRAQTVALTIHGRAYPLPGGRGITLNLPRQFTWQMNEGPHNAESVPAERPSLEIVIR